MWLTDVSIRRPIFIIMFVLALIVLGFQSRSKMPAELEPKIDFPYITVLTTYPGTGPNEMETLVTEPIEKAVGSIGRLRNVTSSSQEGVSTVVLEFELGTNIDSAAADVRDKVSAARGNLPEDIDEPTILKLDIASQPIMTIGLAGTLPPKEMRIFADDTLSDKLAKVGGVASVNVVGGEEREISVAVDKDRLQAYGVGLSAVVQAIKSGNLNVPAGSIKEGTRDYSVRTVGEFTSAEEIANLKMVVPGSKGNPDYTVRIGDIASVRDTVAEPDRLSRLNGEPSVLITIQKQSDANEVSVADGIHKELKEIERTLPAGMKLIIAEDNSVFVKDSLHDVNQSLLEGIFLVVVIVFLFLHTARATFIVAIAIPTSIMATYTPIMAFGFTLNTMVLLALALVVGILVDDSIVVLENIERHLRMRKNPSQAALDGRSEIGLAAVTITLVDIVVFVPIAFMGGIVGQFFRQFGLTVAVATAFSLFMSFTLTPMLASRWMKSEDDKDRDEEEKRERLLTHKATIKDRIDTRVGKLFDVLERGLKTLDRNYRGLLEWALANRFLTLVIGAVSLLTVFAMVIPHPKPGAGPAGMTMMMPRIIIALIALGLSCASMYHSRSKKTALVFGLMMAFIATTVYLPFGFTFFEEVDRGDFAITIRTPPGTSLKATDAVVREIEAILEQVPEITNGGYYMSYVGLASAGGFGGAEIGPQYGRIGVKAVSKKRRERGIREIADWVAQRTARIPGAEMISVTVGSGHGPGSGIMKQVQGQNMDDILLTANRLADIMRKTPGAVDVDVSYKPSKPERRIIVDRERAAQLGLSVAQVAMAARTAIDGDDSAKLRDGGSEYPIRVRFAQADRSKGSDVRNLIIAHRDGAPIYLKDVADVKYDYAPTKIDRKNRQRVVYVTANLATGAAMGNVGNAIDRQAKTMDKAPGTTIGTAGSEQMMIESFGYMISALLLAIVLVYMLMGALFESFLTPFVIMFSLPQAMVGALLALLVTGHVMSIVSMIGIIMLMGLVTKNAILLVDYTNTLRSRGRSRHDAILEAGPTRLRPILMTTLAMIGGMMPTAVALSEGAEMRAPMAIAVIGGLILSTMLTLVVIPVTYTVVDDAWQGLMRRFFPKARASSEQEEERALAMGALPGGGSQES
jgi:HAE1 family hydrophobic/amphiphilic exporter-1